MQEQTGRIEELKELYKESKPSMKGKWIELNEQDAAKLQGMNRKQRRAWLAQERRNGRVFNERAVK